MSRPRQAQRGAVLMVVLVALVAMLVSVIALSRSMDTHHLERGNLAFRNSTVHSSDTGVQSAVLWLQSTVGTPTLNTTNEDGGYYAVLAEPDWDDETFWSQCAGCTVSAADGAGNRVQWVVHRMCSSQGKKRGWQFLFTTYQYADCRQRRQLFRRRHEFYRRCSELLPNLRARSRPAQHQHAGAGVCLFIARVVMNSLSRILAVLFAGLSAAAHAELTDISTTPLTNSVSTQVKPNIMFIVDDSGSMASRFMPEEVDGARVDKARCSNSSCSSTTTNGIEGNPPWNSSQFNSIYYNPKITYLRAINADGTLMPNFGSPWTSVKVNGFVGAATINLVSGYPEIVYCKDDEDDPYNTTQCRRNGINTTNPFQYSTATANGFPNGTGSGAFRFPRVRGGNPFYYDILPREHCLTADLRDCTLSATPTGNYVHPAPVRYCQNTTDANSSSAISGVTSSRPRCQRTYTTNHTHMRYGTFRRTDIVPSTGTYTGRPNRVDCASAPTCTYAEEMTNFANWYAYYSTRMQLMKTGVGYAFTEMDGRYRIGMITINPGSPVSSSKYTPVDTFVEHSGQRGTRGCTR